MARCGGGRPTVESSIILDIRHVTRAALGLGVSQSGQLQWTWPNGPEPVCYAEYQADLSEDAGTLRLANIRHFDSSGRPVRTEGQTIRLVTTAPPYGGRRWWFECPSIGQRVMKLYLPCGAQGFASRQAHHLGYAVQRESAPDRSRRRARKARARISEGLNLIEELPRKPKWMRWATYWRRVGACHQADAQTLKFLIADAERILGRCLTP
jgi:hypothetical protein